jgi:hypothetical protein
VLGSAETRAPSHGWPDVTGEQGLLHEWIGFDHVARVRVMAAQC